MKAAETELTPRQVRDAYAAVLRALDAPECTRCSGRGLDADFEGEVICEDCAGGGRNLDAVTRRSWPWWGRPDIGPGPTPDSIAVVARPRVPDFEADRAAAVELIEELGRRGKRLELVAPRGPHLVHWEVRTNGMVGVARTLGGAVLLALAQL